jgi:hypothetical protein
MPMPPTRHIVEAGQRAGSTAYRLSAALANDSQIGQALKVAPLVFVLRGIREGLSVLHSCLNPCRNRHPDRVPDRHSQEPMSSQ